MKCTCERRFAAEEAIKEMDWEPSKLDELEEMAKRLPFPDTLAAPPGMYGVKVESGRCWYWNPSPHDKATCSQFLNTVGAFDWHTHDQREFLIVYEGEMVLEIEGMASRRLGVGDFAVVEPKTPHRARFEKDCEYYAITVPSTTDWGAPDNARQAFARHRDETSEPGEGVGGGTSP